MARRGSSPVLQAAAVGGIGYMGWLWSQSPNGQAVFNQLAGMFGSKTAPRPTPSSATPAGQAPAAAVPTPAPQPAGSRLQAVNLMDDGGIGLVYDPDINALRQDPQVGGTNVYGFGDEVWGDNSLHLVITGPGVTVDLEEDNGTVHPVSDFFI